MALDNLSDIIEALEDALDYEATGSVTKANAVITNVNKLINRRAQSSSGGGTSMTYDMKTLENLKLEAREWLRYNDTTGNSGGVTYLGPSRGYRG